MFICSAFYICISLEEVLYTCMALLQFLQSIGVSQPVSVDETIHHLL